MVNTIDLKFDSYVCTWDINQDLRESSIVFFCICTLWRLHVQPYDRMSLLLSAAYLSQTWRSLSNSCLVYSDFLKFYQACLCSYVSFLEGWDSGFKALLKNIVSGIMLSTETKNIVKIPLYFIILVVHKACCYETGIENCKLNAW